MGSIVKVQSNVKAGADVELGPKTIIVGPNGSGKSTIVNSVELALTGRASDIAGRVDIAREVEVMSLAKDGDSELEVIATFDDGLVAAYRTSGSTAKAKKATGDKPACVQHDMVLPIRTLREALLGSAQTARKFLLSRVAGAVSEADIRALVGASPLFDIVWGATSGEVPDRLVACVEAAGAKQREAASSAKTARSAAKLASEGRSAPPTAAEMEQARAAEADAQKALAEAVAFARRDAELKVREERVTAANGEAERLATAWVAAKDRLAALPPAPAAPAPVLHDVLKVAGASVEAGECLVCGTDPTGISARAAEVREYLDAYTKANAAHVSAGATVNTARTLAEDALAALERAEAALAEAQKPLSVPTLSVEEASELVSATSGRVRTLLAAADAWATVQRAEATALDAERQGVEWKALKEACEKAVGIVLDKALAVFITTVQSGLPGTDQFDLRLRDGEREVVQFGLVRNGHLHTALSGAEWARVMAAMASACVPSGAYACVIPEERAFDAATLTEVLKALTAIPQQVIITSPVSPKRVPAGWTVIKRGA